MSEYRISYITVPVEVAEQIAQTLVKEELAACVNIIDQMLSIYRWEGQVEKAHESLLIVKFMSEKTDELIQRVREIHPYEVPEFIAFDITAGNPDYLDWLSGKEINIDDLEIDDEDLDLDEDEDEEVEDDEDSGDEEEGEKATEVIEEEEGEKKEDE
ncbi:MAG: divalent-cation tolerance protein CutA [Candidatus Zixiibacteriota bacterium]